MDAGRMNKLISITKTTSTSRADSGAPVMTVSTLSSNVWAEARPITGREFFANDAVFYEADIDFVIRYTTIVTELCRIKFNNEFYDIKKFIDFKSKNIELHILGKVVR